VLSLWDWPLTWKTHPSVLLHCWLGHLTCKIVPEVTYNVSSGTLNPTIQYNKLLVECMHSINRTYSKCIKSIYNNWIVKMSRHARGLRGRASSADWLRARIDSSGGGGQARIAMSRQGRGLRGRAGGYKQYPPQSGVTAFMANCCSF